MAQEIVQITGQPQPFFCHRLTGQLTPRGMQFSQRLCQASDADHIQAQPPDQQHKWQDMQPIRPGEAAH